MHSVICSGLGSLECFVIIKCTKFGQLKAKIVATRCQILRLKCTKFNFSWGSVPDPTEGAYSAPQTPALRGPTSKGREGDETKDETPPLHAPPLSHISGYAPGLYTLSP